MKASGLVAICLQSTRPKMNRRAPARKTLAAAASLARTGALAACLALSTAFAVDQQATSESDNVRGLSLHTQSTNVVLAWPSDPRESFLVLARSNPAPETLWAILTNHMPATSGTNCTTFLDIGGASHDQVVYMNTNLPDLYRVLLIPDFWLNPEGVQLDGGPQHCGGDFLPIYDGTSETDPYKRPFNLHVELVVDSERATEEEAIDLRAAVDDAVERVNLGTLKHPRWICATGFWLQHDLLANGPHTLQLRTLLRLNLLVGPGEQFLTITNPSVRVVTTNAITFPEWNSQVGGNWRFAAKSTEPRVNWRIEIRDSKGLLLINKTGSTTNGVISWIWDLRDAKGTLHDDFNKDQSFSPSVTTWPLDQKEGANHDEQQPSKDQGAQNWWVQRLGVGFIRKKSTSEEDRAKPPSAQDGPRGNQVESRPLALP